MPGTHSGLVTASTSPATRGPNLAASAATALSPAARGQAVGMILDRVVEQGRADHVDVVDAVVAHDPQRHPQQVIDVRLTLAPVGGMQIPRELQRPRGLLPAGRVREPRDLGGEPGPQPLLAVHGRDRVQRHHRDQPQIRLIDRTAAARRRAGRAGAIRVAGGHGQPPART